MPKALSVFNAKLAEIAEDYQRLHLQCLSLKEEISSLRGAGHHTTVEAYMPRMLAESPRMADPSKDGLAMPPVPREVLPKEVASLRGAGRHTVEARSPRMLAETPRMLDNTKDGVAVPLVPREVFPRLLATPRLRCHSAGVSARSESTSGRLQERAESDDCNLIVGESLPSDVESAIHRWSLSSSIGKVSPGEYANWSRLTKMVLSGGRPWKVDPVWHTNVRIRMAKPPPMELENVVSKLSRGSSTRRKVAKESSYMSSLLPPFHPESSTRQIWDLFSIFLLLHDFIMLPLAFFGDLAFDNVFELTILKALFWTADMLISCVTGYYRNDGGLEMDFRRIGKKYLKTHFLIDFPITVLDWLLLGLTPQSSVSGISRLLFRSVRGLRLLRFLKGLQRTSTIAENICTEYIIVGLGISKLLICIALASHYIACFWYGLSQLEINDTLTPTGWAQVRLARDGDNMAYAYTTSLHWALTQFTPASMEVVPENVVERVFACIVILTALVIFSSFVSSITQAMNYLRQLSQKKRLQETAIRKFLEQRSIGHDTIVKIWRFIRRHKLTESSLVQESDLPVLQQLPSALRMELKQQLHFPILTKHPLFLLLKGCDPEFLKVLCTSCLREVQVGVGMEAFAPGSEINDMVFVLRGMMEFVSSDAIEKSLVHVREWVCELSLWANHVQLPGVFLGFDKGCELILLSSTTFRRSARKYSAHFSLLADYAIRFVKVFKSLSPGDASRPSQNSEILFDVADSAMLSSAEEISESVLFNEFDLVNLIVGYAAAEHPQAGFTRKSIMKERVPL